jgi:membrane metallo-endopeptidase-like protein 1
MIDTDATEWLPIYLFIQGVTRDKVRWQKCVEFVNERMGMAVGAMFLRDNFRKESKVVALEMISDIREAFNEILFESDWMDEETKVVAKEKVGMITVAADTLDKLHSLGSFDEVLLESYWLERH